MTLMLGNNTVNEYVCLFEISHMMSVKKQSPMRRLFGFELADFQSWSSFVKLMNRPEDPTSLAVLRIFFGMIERQAKQ